MSLRKLNKKDYTVGQKVVLKLNGNASRYKEKNAYITGVVDKIGNKIMYITSDSGTFSNQIKINMDTGVEHSDFTPNYILYNSEQEFKDSLEGELIISEIRNLIGQYEYRHIDINKLREIKKILELD